MRRLRAKRPTDPVKYEKAKTIFSFPARDTLLWVLDCLYVETGLPTEVHLASIYKGHKGYFHVTEIKLIKEIEFLGLDELEHFDVILLCKIIEVTCNLDGNEKNDSEKETRLKIKEAIDRIRNNRHLFAHDRKEVVILSSSDLEQLISSFIEDVDFLIRESGQLSSKSLEEISEELQITTLDIYTKWEFEEYRIAIDDVEETQDEAMETEITSKNISKTFQDKNKNITTEEDGNLGGACANCSTTTVQSNSHIETDDISTDDLMSNFL